jgi:hypothetical protein
VSSVDALGKYPIAILSGCRAVEVVEDPFEDTAVFAVARPEEAAVFVATEPVDEEDLGKLCFSRLRH